MTQLQLDSSNGVSKPASVSKLNGAPKSAVLHRHLRHEFLSIERGEGHSSFWKTVEGSSMPQAAQLWLALVYVHHIVSISSEMLFHHDGLAPFAFLSVHVSRLTFRSMEMMP